MIPSGDLATTLLELAPDATVVVDANGTVIFANARVEQTLGYQPHELLGKSVDILLPARIRGSHGRHRAQFNATPKPRPMGRDLPLLGLHKNGREFPVEISLSPVPSDAGPLVVAAIRDALDTLSTDPNDNVREAVLTALIDAKRPEAVTVAMTALTRPDYQLVITATKALADATLAPIPIMKLCMEKPSVLFSSGNWSAMNARKGSMEILMDESRIHSKPAAIQRADELGMKMRQTVLSTAPIRKKGRRRPSEGFQVRSLR